MKKIITFGILLLTFINSFGVFSIYVEETTIILKPGLNSVSTPGLLKGISFSNGGDNITFATLLNQKRNPIYIKNDNVGQVFSPLTGFIVRNDTSEDVIMTLSYDTDNNSQNTIFEKILNQGRNLLGITNTTNPFKNSENVTLTNIIDLTDGYDSNKIIEGNTFQEASSTKLGKAYGIFIDSINEGTGLYSGKNNNAKLNGFTESECQEICIEDENNCPNECKSGILSKNKLNNIVLQPNDDPKTIYEGNYTANKSIQINSIQINGDNTMPQGDSLKLYVYINNLKKAAITLNSSTYNIKITIADVTINQGVNIPIKIEAQYNGETNNGNYNLKLKLSGEPKPFYANSQNIEIIITRFLQAYNRANSKGILNNQIISYETLNSGINNTELALFMNNYSKTVLNHITDTNKDCSFIDSEFLTDNQFNAALESCQLGLIQEDDSIDFNNQSDLSTFSILLSRALWNDRYNGGNHLNALQVAGIIKDTANPEDSQVKGDILIALMNSEGKNEYRRTENSYNFAMDDFNAVEDIYSNIRTSDGDRVIFIVRHSARINQCDSEGGLTDTGIELARGVGEKLKGAPFEDTSTDFYGSSTVKRTVQTSYYVGESRGSEVLESIIDDNSRNEYNFVNHSPNINNIVYGNYFSDGTKYSSIEHLYEENKDITNERSINAINKLCNMTDGHPFSRITSHDWYTLPITEWATNENITFHISNRDRPNFMQGIAVIVHSYGGWEVYPVRSLETGKIDKNLNPSC